MRTTTLSISKVQREQQWRERLARHAVSDQSVEAFCRGEAVSVPMFYYWRTQLRKREQAAVSPAALAPTTSPFLDLGSLHERAASNATGPGKLEVRLDLGDGLIVTLVRH